MAEAIFNLHEAKSSLSRLVDRAAAGEEIIIAKAGKPMAKLTARAGGLGGLGRRPTSEVMTTSRLSRLVRQAKPGEGERDVEQRARLGNLLTEPSGYPTPPGRGWPPAGTECCVVAA